MKDIAIYGAGGFGREVACLLNAINEKTPTWHLVGFFDDNPSLKGKMISHYGMCLGGADDLNAYPEDLSVTIPIGNSKVVNQILEKITNPKVTYPNLISPVFRCSDIETFSIGQGNIITAGCVATCNVSIGDFNVLNGDVVMGHDVTIGSFNTFMPAVRVSGEVQIGDFNFFGVGTIIIQQLRIGNNVRIGAGAVLLTKPKEGELYIGNPAKRIKF